MRGLMQVHALTIPSILRHAARHHGATDIVSRLADGTTHRTSYPEVEARARRLIGALRKLGVEPGERVATLAWNSFRHLELYYAIPGIGAVCHTVNPRLNPADIAHILSHAEDRVLFTEPEFLPLLARVMAAWPTALKIVVLSETVDPAALPNVTLLAYEDFLTAAPDTAWPDLQESQAAGLCYTSGTTGRPRGVLYSHRSTVLHAMGLNGADAFAFRAIDRVLLVVPMFHVMGWGVPFAAPMAGAALLLPGKFLDGAALHRFIEAEQATTACAVPTVWLGLLHYLRQSGGSLSSLRRITIGGAPCPPALIEGFAEYGAEIRHGWGMTETSPLVTYNAPTPRTARLTGEAAMQHRLKQGRALFGVDVRAQDDAGAEVPRDGATPGHIACRGHWVAERYFGEADSAGEWLLTGDVGTVDEDGFVALTDRSKDLIKSGGEWISSIALENIALSHPDVLEAAVIAVRHPTWGERPLLLAVPRAGAALEADNLLGLYAGRMPKWSRPEAAIVLADLPHGATGKILKTELRARFAKYLLDLPRPK